MRDDPIMENVIVRARMVSFIAATLVADADCWADVTEAIADCMASDADACNYQKCNPPNTQGYSPLASAATLFALTTAALALETAELADA